MYGKHLGFIPDFLTSDNSVKVEFKKSNELKDICNLSGLPQAKWDLNHRNEFMRRFSK